MQYLPELATKTVYAKGTRMIEHCLRPELVGAVEARLFGPATQKRYLVRPTYDWKLEPHACPPQNFVAVGMTRACICCIRISCMKASAKERS